MSMTKVDLQPKPGGISGGDDSVEIEYILTFTGTYTPPEALALTGVPAQGSQYGSTGLYCSSRTTKLVCEADGLLPGTADISISYSIRTSNLEDLGTTPLSRTPQISWGAPEITEVRKIDVDGLELRNSAGQFFADLPEFYIFAASCVITLNVADNPADDIALYSFTTNETTWNGVGVGNALIGSMSAQLQKERFNGADVTYWQLSVPITFRRDGWNWHTYDIGSMVKDGSNVVQYLDANGTPAIALLDGSGAALSDQTDEPVEWPDEDGFVIYESAEFASLGLPNPFA